MIKTEFKRVEMKKENSEKEDCKSLEKYKPKSKRKKSHLAVVVDANDCLS